MTASSSAMAHVNSGLLMLAHGGGRTLRMGVSARRASTTTRAVACGGSTTARRGLIVASSSSSSSSSSSASSSSGWMNRRAGASPLIRADAPTLLRNARGVYGSAAASESVGTSETVSDTTRDLSKLWLLNTMSRKKELFVPRDPAGKRVQMYVCGVTVYDYSHIGHARVYVAFDVLYRQLMRLGYDVTYCRNFTDIDDKIIKRSNESGETCEALTDKFIEAFHEDMTALGCLRPTVEPRATECVDDIIAFIERLITKGNAYEADGDVYFAVDTLPAYGV